MYKIAADGGSCNSISQMARYLKVSKSEASMLCNTLTEHIIFFKKGNKKILHFSDFLIDKGLNVENIILKKESEGE